MELMRWARERDRPLTSKLPLAQPQKGTLRCCNGLQGCPSGPCTSQSAVSQGHLEVLQWLKEQGCPWIQQSPNLQRREATWSCCSGRWHMDSPGRRAGVIMWLQNISTLQWQNG